MKVAEPVVEEVSYEVFVRMWSVLAAWCVEHGDPVPDRAWMGGITAPGMTSEEGLRVLLEAEEGVRWEAAGRRWVPIGPPGNRVERSPYVQEEAF
jgi:hypothetical protein